MCPGDCPQIVFLQVSCACLVFFFFLLLLLYIEYVNRFMCLNWVVMSGLPDVSDSEDNN
jgi:hypothetical protein